MINMTFASDADKKRAAFLDAMNHRRQHPFPKDIDVEKLREEAMEEKYGFSLLSREKSDYTKWRQRYFADASSDEFHIAALSYGKENPL